VKVKAEPLVQWAKSNVQTLAIIVVFALLLVLFASLSPYFLTERNLASAGRDIAPTVIVAVAMTFVITAGQIDLSPGSLLAVTGAALGIFGLQYNPLIAIALVLLIGLGSGFFLGYISSYQRVPAFIVTLAALTGLRGVAELMTGGYSTKIQSPILMWFGSGKIFSIYSAIWIAAIISIIGWYVFARTRYGLYTRAVGSGEESARRVGINTRRIKMYVLAGTGIATAIGGILVATRLGSGSSNIGVAFELEAITAVVLGGTNLLGGKGSIIGSIIGALTLGVLENGLVLIGLNVFWVPILQGAILLIAILANYRIFSRIAIS